MKNKRTKTLFTLLTLLLSTSLYSQSRTITSIPFSIEKNCIYIYCKVNGTDSLKFLFDTGADGSVINQSSLPKANLKIDGKSLNVGSNGKNEVEMSSKNDILIGTIHKKEVSFTIIEYGDARFDGVLGTDLMKGHIIEIDYHKQLVNFYKDDDKNIDYTGYTKLKMYSEIYPTYIKSKMIIDGKEFPGLFGLDTGADDALTIASPFARKNDLVNKMPLIGSASFQGSDGSVQELRIVLCPEIQFAGKYLYRVPAALSQASEGIDANDTLAGFFGNAFLKKFNTIIDYKNHFIYFKLNHNLYSDYQDK
jgi:hypothetical protein